MILAVASAALLGAAVFFTTGLIREARKAQEMKTDLAELNHVRYGMLNADAWRDQITLIVSKRIVEFDLTPENRGELQKSLEVIMYNLLDDLELVIEERTSGSFSQMKKMVADMVLNVDQLRDSVPSYASQVLDEINKPATKRSVQTYLTDKLGDLSDATYSMDSTGIMEYILDKYQVDGRMDGQAYLSQEIEKSSMFINRAVMWILMAVVLLFIFNAIGKGPPGHLQTPFLVLGSLCLLIGGITTPMIDLEARVDLLRFTLIGEVVEFRDNIIFFQTKSITDIVRILMEEGSFEMILVGILIFTFSIVFPLSKLLSSFAYSFGREKVNQNKLIRFFVIKSGKWSMADVIVVAIFMAYVGFNGIVSSQMRMLERSSEMVDIFTTNGTQLLGGFYLFLGFTLSSLLLSEILTKKQRS